MTYTQKVKGLSRQAVWRHAVISLTTNRKSSRILTEQYMRALWSYVWGDVLPKVIDLSEHRQSIQQYFDYWYAFADSCYGTKRPDELRVAYFSGPEPENDLNELLSLGVRIENIWAFESDQATYQQALKKARAGFPFLKIFPGSLTDFFRTNHLLFDIIYLDFTGSLVTRSLATLGALHAAFDEQALADLSVLIVNSCEPDPTPDVCDFLSAYFYFQPMVECTAYGEEPHDEESGKVSWFSEPACAHGYQIDDLKRITEKHVTGVYSAFATSYPLYYSSFISPTLRFLRNSALRRQLFSTDKSAQIEAFDRLSDISVFASLLEESSTKSKDFTSSGDRLLNADSFSLWNFIDALGSVAGELGRYWSNEFSRPKDGASVLDAARFREALRKTLSGYDGLLADNFRNEIKRVNAAIPDARGGLFCDIPMAHLWLELALNQLGAPYHANIRNHRRWTYKARVRRMHLDAFTFDRCRSLYDSLPMVDAYGDVLANLLPQMMARCCIDAIGKEARWALPNLYFGSSVACIGEVPGADFAELLARTELDKG